MSKLMNFTVVSLPALVCLYFVHRILIKPFWRKFVDCRYDTMYYHWYIFIILLSNFHVKNKRTRCMACFRNKIKPRYLFRSRKIFMIRRLLIWNREYFRTNSWSIHSKIISKKLPSHLYSFIVTQMPEIRC